MRLLRALGAALFLSISLALVVTEPGPARAQDVGEAEERAADAARRAEEAASLLSEAAAIRAGVEDELAATLTRLAELNAELSRVSVRLDDLRQAVQAADADLARINETLTIQAVDAYVRAVSVSAASLIGTGSTESAIVAATSLETAIGDDQAAMADLTIQRRELDELRQAYLAEQEEVQALQQQVDAESAHLESLLAEADAGLAQAAAQARQADAEYRAALDAVDLARAKEEEKARQGDRQPDPSAATRDDDAPASTTTTPSGPTSEPTPTTATTTTSPPPTTTTAPPAPLIGGPFRPEVERWRGLVAAYFPAERVDEALAVLGCESNGDPNAYNPYSGASGLFQFLPATWATVSPSAGFSESSVFDPEANIGTAAWLSSYYESRGASPWSPWTCRP